MRTSALCFLLLAVPGVAAAQVLEIGTSLLTSANAQTPGGCNVMDGGGTFTEATAACSTMGYLAAAHAESSLATSTSGGEVSVFAEASATATGSPSDLTASGIANSVASITWYAASDQHYSVSTTLQGATASFEDTSGSLPASGVLTMGEYYTLNAHGFAFALAQDSNGAETVHAGPLAASAQVTFASVASSTLIRGSVLGCGVPVQGLLVEALSGGAVIASTITGDDGTYLLPDLPGTVDVRVSDPNGVYATEVFAGQTPPIVFDADLGKQIPALPAPAVVAAALVLAWVARTALRRRSQPARA